MKRNIIKEYFKRKIEEVKAYGKKNIIIRLITIVLTVAVASLLIVFLKVDTYYKNTYTIDYLEANFQTLEKIKILEIISIEENDNASIAYDKHITYKGMVLKGEDKGKECIVHQYLNDYIGGYSKIVTKEKTVYAARQAGVDDTISYFFNADSISYSHVGGLILLSCILVVLLLAISKTKGLLTIISLVLALLSIVYIFLPRILRGENIYLLTCFVCIFVVVVTYLIVVGANKKCLCATLGCLFGLLLSGVLALITLSILNVTGHFANEYTADDVTMLYQSLYNVNIHIDLRGIIFAATLIGALGAVMDVSLSLASSLKEVYDNAKERSILNTIKSGFNIGKDMIGTMVNTLILAYIASDLSFILYMMVHHSNELIFRSEYLAIAIAQALVGSIAMVLTIPLTSLICAFLYNKKQKEGEVKNEEV